MEKFTLEFNYGGAFVRGETIQYVGGQQEVIGNLDGDEMSMFEIQDMLTELGVTKWKTLQYCDPRFELHKGLKSLSSDSDVLAMVSSLHEKMYVRIYVECEVQVDELEADSDSGRDESEGEISVNECENIDIEVASVSASLDEQLRSLNGSDEDCREEWAEFTSTSTDVELGMTFGSLAEIKELVVDYAVTNGHNIKFVKNEKVRLTAICVEDCKWRLHASKMQNEGTYQKKSYRNIHTCARSMENRHASASWVVKKYQERFKSQPDWQLPSIIETVQQDYNVNISSALAYRVRSKAKKLNDGCGKEQYKQLWSYAEEIRRTNPGSTFVVSLERVTETSLPTFQRAYMCFHACKQGLLTGGRPIICLDGCHLKGQCPGHLLTAVGIDGNDGIYPIAVAVVESECTDSWNWFLEILLMDLHIDRGVGWTFMSDQQKGLIDTLQRLVPSAEIRYCVCHMYANFKNKFCGNIYKDAMMNASRATTTYAFEREMRKLSFVDQVAYRHLRNIQPGFWAKHAFSHVPKCDISLNNLSESFNALILPARDKLIITMLKKIRKLLMTRIAKWHKTMQECTGLLCPRIKKKLDTLKKDARNWSPIPAGGECFEVSDPNIIYIVDLGNRTCSCCAWGLTGIPCVHVIPCILFMRRTVEEYVHPHYHRQTYLTMYSHFMHPINSPERWPATDMDEIMPPTFRHRPGRPKKKRVRDADEPQSSTVVSRKHRQMNCSKCHQTGHNARSCQGVRSARLSTSRAIVVSGSTSSAQAQHSQTGSTGGRRGRGRRGRRENDTFVGFNSISDVRTQGSSFEAARRWYFD